MPVFQLTEELIFPPPELAEKDGLLAIGGDLSPARLLVAYKSGIFPWYSPGTPLLWWSPAPRCILEPARLIISKRLARTIRKKVFRVTVDTAFGRVIGACADTPRKGGQGTWITPEMIAAYTLLHTMGYAHSVECWQEGELAGGLYGIALGRIFFGESMFAAVSDASKVALASLVGLLRKWNFDLIDCQIKNDHLLRLGAREISRAEFQARLAAHVDLEPGPGKWRVK